MINLTPAAASELGEEIHYHYSQQPQQSEQQVSNQPHNPSTVEASDQSCSAHYLYGQYWNPQYQYSCYPFQDPAKPNQQHHLKPESPSSSIHPPGVPVASETTNAVTSSQGYVQEQPIAYYPREVVPLQYHYQQQQQHFIFPGSGGLNEVNTSFQNPHWAGNFVPIPVYARPGSTHPRIGQPANRSKGKRDKQGDSMAWCDLCRVECNTLEILEQHRNGKKHLKNLQSLRELQDLNHLIATSQVQILHPPNNAVERSGKRRRRPAADDRAMFLPLTCEVCNIRCESQGVFESHLGGRKHLSRVKVSNAPAVLCSEDGAEGAELG